MPFIPEDGTGLVDATSLVSVASADTYFADVGNASWAALALADKEIALVKATRYMEKRFGTRYKGSRATAPQALAFPRIGLSDDRGDLVLGVPGPIGYACCEYALASLTHPLVPPVVYPVVDGQSVASGTISRKLEKVGPITEETYYATGGANASTVSSGSSLVDANKLVQYPEADLLVGPYLRSGGRVMR